jgi:hypothetical protein
VVGLWSESDPEGSAGLAEQRFLRVRAQEVRKSSGNARKQLGDAERSRKRAEKT